MCDIAYSRLFESDQKICFQEKLNSLPTFLVYPFECDTDIFQFIVLNPFSETASKRNNESVKEIQSVTIEQDCISKELQIKWVKDVLKDNVSVMMDSGGKSIHNHIRFKSPISQSQKDLLIKEIKKAFPFCDKSVVSNNACLVRNPGATRDNGNKQKIIEINSQVSFYEVLGLLNEFNKNISGTIKPNVSKTIIRLYKQKNVDDDDIIKSLSELLKCKYDLSVGSLFYDTYSENLEKNKRNSLSKLILTAIEKSEKQEAKVEVLTTKQVTVETKIKYSDELDEMLARINLLDVLLEHYPGTKYKHESGHTRIWCPFHEDTKHSAWISKAPNGIERYFCSVDTCQYWHGNTHGLTALYFTKLHNRCRTREAIKLLTGITPETDFIYKEENLNKDDIVIPQELIPKQNSNIIFLSEIEDDFDLNSYHNILDILNGNWGFKRHLLITATQGSGKSYALCQKAVQQLEEGKSTVLTSQCHSELDQLEQIIRNMLLTKEMSLDMVFHMRGISSIDDEVPREIPSRRPVILVIPHAYFQRKDDSLFTFDIVKMIKEKEFGKDAILMVDEAGAFIDARHVSRPLGARYINRCVRGYQKLFLANKCPLYASSGNCSNCLKIMGLTSRGVRGTSISFCPIGQHNHDEDLSKRLLDVNLDKYIHKFQLTDKTLSIKAIAGEEYEKLKKRIQENRQLKSGSKNESQVQSRLHPQEVFEDMISYMFFPHVLYNHIYDCEENANKGRPLNEEELLDRKENPRRYAAPQTTCDIPILQGWDYLVLDQIKDSINIVFSGPKPSDNNLNYLKYVFPDDICIWESQKTYAPLEDVSIISVEKELKYRHKSTKTFFKDLRETYRWGETGILSFSPTKDEARQDYEHMCRTLVSTFFDGVEHHRRCNPTKISQNVLYQSYSHGPLGAGLNLYWFKICIIKTNIPKPKAALTTEFFLSLNKNPKTFMDLSLQDTTITTCQNMGRIIRADPNNLEKDLKIPRIIILHGPNAKQIGEFCQEYFSNVKHKIRHIACDTSVDFFKEVTLKIASGENIDDMESMGSETYEHSVLQEGAKETIRNYLKDHPEAMWGHVHQKLYDLRKLSKKLKVQIKNWFEETIAKPRKIEIKIKKLKAKIDTFVSRHPEATISDINRGLNLQRLKKTSEISKHINTYVSEKTLNHNM